MQGAFADVIMFFNTSTQRQILPRIIAEFELRGRQIKQASVVMSSVKQSFVRE